MLRPKHVLPILCSLGFAAAAVAQDAPALDHFEQSGHACFAALPRPNP